MQGIDRKRLAKLSVECYLEQLLTYGFFHAGVNYQLGVRVPCSQLPLVGAHSTRP